MKIKHDPIEIDNESPFKNCKFDRGKYAETLTQIVGSYSEGFVFAINNEWGTGKTTFVKMWEKQLQNNKFKTIYFNAWENDFEQNPMVALMAELKKISKSKEDIYNSLIKKSASITKS